MISTIITSIVRLLEKLEGLEFLVRIENLDSKKGVIIVAEIGNNHEGSFSLAKKLIDEAAKAGVDAVKFQTFQTKTFVAPTQKERFQRMRGFELTFDQFRELAEHAWENRLRFISTPLDMPSALFLSQFADAIKIASGDNTFYPLIRFAAETKKPLIISTGFANEATIDRLVSLVSNSRKQLCLENNFALLHCVSAYPVETNDANLSAISSLYKKFSDKLSIGYSDHTLGLEAATLAVALGARIIEKHFTIDRHYSDFRDHQLSADPGMMSELVTKIRNCEAYLGDGKLEPRKVEIDTELPVRRSIAAAKKLEIGHVVEDDDLMWIRPGEGLPPGTEHDIIGKTLTNEVREGELFSEQHFSTIKHR